MKAMLWVVGTVVILLLIYALATGGPRKKTKPKPAASVAPSAATARRLA
jgi:hypothetical protein